MYISNLQKGFIFSVFLLAIGFLTLPTSLNAGEKSSAESQQANDTTAEQDAPSDMELWKEFATPGENHKVLDTFVGTWDYTVKWWSSPNSEPEVSKGTSEVNWIMGGRFLEQTAKGTSMGQPFEGMGITGYDNARKEYVSVWIDNMGTGLMASTGKYDATTKTFEEKGKFTQPKMGETPFKGITKILSNDNFVYEIYTKDKDWQEYKALEIVYTRKK